MYCTIEQARAAGATGSDEFVASCIVDARELIDQYTGDMFEPTVATIVARVAPDGTAQLPVQVRSVSAVRVVGATVALPESGYLVLSSSVRGQIDAVVLGGGGRSDILVVGAEPWNGGYSGLVDGRTGQVAVTGLYGHETPPVRVRDCAAVLAASRSTGATSMSVPGPAVGVPDTDDEGNAVSITVDAEAPRARTTGNAAVDVALGPFVRGVLTVS